MMHGLVSDLLGKREANRCGRSRCRCANFIAGLANDSLSLVGAILIKRGLVLKGGLGVSFSCLLDLFFQGCLNDGFDAGHVFNR